LPTRNEAPRPKLLEIVLGADLAEAIKGYDLHRNPLILYW